jgi:hypothetical protein
MNFFLPILAFSSLNEHRETYSDRKLTSFRYYDYYYLATAERRNM